MRTHCNLVHPPCAELPVVSHEICGVTRRSGNLRRPRSKNSDTMSMLRRPFARIPRGPLMTALPKALIAWSSGKDSAWALHEARRAGEFDIVGALDHGDRQFRARQHAWRARGIAACAARGRRTAGDRRAHSLSVPERNLRARNGGGDRRRQGARRYAYDFRRSVSGGRARLSRDASSPAPASRRCFRSG